MIQNWIGRLLFNFVGDLVEDFPNNEIEINKWQGVGEKKNIKFKQNKIREWMMEYFGLNVDVITAEIGLLQFKIPWNRIWKEPTKILIKDCFICVSTRNEFSLELMNLRRQNFIRDFIENCYKRQINNSSTNKKESKFKRLLKNFFSEMFILEVQNFHLRLEDQNNSFKNHKIALGFLFKSLTLHPQYNNKNEQEIKRKLDFSVEEMSCYLKIDTISKMSHNLAPNFFEPTNVIFEPFTLKIIIHTNLTQQEDIPLRLIEIQFADDIKLNIDDQQFQTILRLLRLRDWYCQQGEHFKYRPSFDCRPKDDSGEWVSYWRKIILSISEMKRNRQVALQKIFQQIKIQKKLVNLILIELFHSQYQMNEDHKYLIDDQQHTFQEVMQQKQEIEDSLQITEEIEFIFQRVNKLLNSPDQLKEQLKKLNLEQQQQIEKKSTIWKYFWKQKQQTEEGTEFQSMYEKLFTQLCENDNRCLKRFEIKIQNIQISLKIAQEKQVTFMKIELNDSLFLYETFQKIKRCTLKFKRIDAFDCLNPNKDFQNIFCYHQYIDRSQRNKYFNQEQSQIELLFEQNKEQQKSIFKVKSLPHLMSLNDTVLARLQPFLKKLRKNDYFYDIVSYGQGNMKSSELLNIIKKLCSSNSLIIDINIAHITVRIPESAIKKQCPILELTLENYQLQFMDQVSQSINKFAISFQYVQDGQQQIIYILQPFSINSKVSSTKTNQQTDLVIENKISDIQIEIPILKTDFLKNFVYNVLGTLENLKKISIFLERDDLLQQQTSSSVNRRKRSRSWSQRELSSKREDCSSQTSDVYYDAEEFVNVPFLQSFTQSKQYVSPQEKREEMLKKWNKIRMNLNYLMNKIFKEADPRISELLESLQLKSIFDLQRLQIRLATQKKKERYTYFYIDNLNAIIDKPFQEVNFSFNLCVNQITFSFYKIGQLQQFKKYSGPQSDELMNHINEDVLNLLPFLLRVKELQVNYQISINEIKLEFQNVSQQNNNNYMLAALTKFYLASQKPFRVMYKQQLADKPFFLEINNSNVSQWDTTCDCKFYINIQYFNDRLRCYEPFLENTFGSVTFQKSHTEVSFETKFSNLYFNFTPDLIQSFYELNQNSLQIKQFLLYDLNDSQDNIIEQKQTLTQKFEIEIENDNAKLLVEQIDIQHSQHYKTKYRIHLNTKEVQNEEQNQKQDNKHVTFQVKQFVKQQSGNFKKQQSQVEDDLSNQEQASEKGHAKRISSEIDVSEKQSMKDTRFMYEVLGDCLLCEQSIKYIFVNLTVQKLLFNLNGIEQYINEKESKFVRCTEIMSFKITSSLKFFRYTALIKNKEDKTYFLKTDNRDHKLKTIYYLLSIINRNQNQIIIYQIEQLPKAPYLLKNKCSQLVIISQQGFDKQQTVLEPGKQAGFCWEDPFQNSQLQLEIHYEGEIKKFLIDIDRFNNQEIQIDKNLNSKIDKEYSLEIFNDGLQKVIVLTETESLKKKNKSYKISCELIGISLIDQLEILYIEINKVQYLQQQQKDIKTYLFQAKNVQFDAQSFPTPKRQLYIMNQGLNQQQQQKVLIPKKVPLQQLPQVEQSQANLFPLKLKVKQKTITEILVHFKYVKIRIPHYKIIFDGDLFLQLFSFIKHTKELLDRLKQKKMKNKNLQQSFDKLNNSNISDKQHQIQPKKIHIDKVIIRSFAIKMKFKNLQNIEQELKTLHHYAGLITFALSQFSTLSLEFQPYQQSDYQQFMETNYEFHIKSLFSAFSQSINHQIRGQINTMNFFKNQGNLAKQFLQELKNLEAGMNNDDIFQGGLPVKFQLLQTAFVIGKSFYEAIQDTFVTVLLGIGKYYETEKPDQNVPRTSFSNKLSKLFRKVSDFQFKNLNSQEISFQMLISRLKTRRCPKFIQKNKQIINYSEDLSKIQLYRLWKLGLENNFSLFKLAQNHFLCLQSEILVIIDTQYNQILLEINQKKFQSITNTNSTCMIKYLKSNNNQDNEEDIGMNSLKIAKLMLNFTVDEEILNQINSIIKKNVQYLQFKENKIFSIMTFE